MAERPDISGGFRKVIEEGAQRAPKKKAGDPLLFEQIESSADYYPPGLYAKLLSYYGDLELGQDSLATQFIPLSPSAQKGNPKKFIVGILPPTSNVTGRLLDRSSSIAAIEGIIPDVLGSGARIEDISQFQEPENAPKKGDRKVSWGVSGPDELGDEFWVDFVSMCKRLNVDPKELAAVIYTESGFNPAAQAKSGETSVAKGLIQNLRGTLVSKEKPPPAGKMTPEQWEEYNGLSAEQQLYFVEPFLRGARIGGKKRADIHVAIFGAGYEKTNPNGELYCSLDYQDRYISEKSGEIQARLIAGEITPEESSKLQTALSKTFKDSSFQQTAYKFNVGLDKSGRGAITRADFIGLDGGPPGSFLAAIDAAIQSGEIVQPINNPFGEGAGDRKPWVGDGSPNAAAIREQLFKIAKTGLNATGLGQRFQAAQAAQIKATQAALSKMQKTPPLRMLVNPKSFSVRGEKITSDGNWSRNGHIIEHWGDQQDKISGSGSLAGFYSIDISNANGPGITRMARNFSQAYQNFQSLYLLYRNNAGLYLPDFGDQDKHRNLSVLGSIYIYYDNILYIGSFDSFNITEDDTKPFSLDYSFEFTVRAVFLLDHPSEQGFTYGAPGLFSTQTSPSVPDPQIDAGGIPGVLGAQEAADFIAKEPPTEPTQSDGVQTRSDGEIQEDRERLRKKFEDGAISQLEYDTLISGLDREASPQTPGNEPGAVRGKLERAAERARLAKKFENGQLSFPEYDTLLRAVGPD